MYKRVTEFNPTPDQTPSDSEMFDAYTQQASPPAPLLAPPPPFLAPAPAYTPAPLAQAPAPAPAVYNPAPIPAAAASAPAPVFAPAPIPAPVYAPAPIPVSPAPTLAPEPDLFDGEVDLYAAEPEFEDDEGSDDTAHDVEYSAPSHAQPRRAAHRDTSARVPAKARDRERERERTLIRRTAAKYTELLGRPAADLELLAAILGTTASVPDLTVMAMTATVKDFQIAADTLAIMDADVVEAAVEAAALGRPRVKGIWSLLTHLGVLTQEPRSPSSAVCAKASTGMRSAPESTGRSPCLRSDVRRIHVGETRERSAS